MKKVKSIRDILKELDRKGYSLTSPGSFSKPGHIPFAPEMFNSCGETPDPGYTWAPEWLEDTPTVGSWCKFWDTYDREPDIEDAVVGILGRIDRNPGIEYPYVHGSDGEHYFYAKELKGELEEIS